MPTCQVSKTWQVFVCAAHDFAKVRLSHRSARERLPQRSARLRSGQFPSLQRAACASTAREVKFRHKCRDWKRQVRRWQVSRRTGAKNAPAGELAFPGERLVPQLREGAPPTVLSWLKA